MTISLESIPRLTEMQALDVAQREYGIEGAVSMLPSERDQNFLIAGADGRKFVLKIANLNDAPQLLDFQNQAMRLVAGSAVDCGVQQVVCSLRGAEIAAVADARTGSSHCVRLLTWIEGAVLAESVDRDAVLFESIGTGMATVDAALRGFTHPAMHRELQWDLRRAGMAREHTGLLPHRRRTRIEKIFAQWDSIDWNGLRHSVIHGDANDHNVIVGDGRMTGLLDFGDMSFTATVCDLAIVLAYVMLGEEQPWPAAGQIIRAYHSHYPLTEMEQSALFHLILSRLGLSVCYSAHNRARNPGDAYQVVSEAAAWKLLDKLESCPDRDALAMIRAACAAPAARVQ